MDSPSANQTFLSLQNAGIAFNGVDVLRNINFDIPKGQTLVVIGESGCGKTVLLKLLISLLQASTGKVLFDGQDWCALDDKRTNDQRLRFGFLFQGAALFDSLTVFDNVAFGLRAHSKCDEKEIEKLVLMRVKEVGMKESVLGKKPAELSGGMKKRIGLARALILNPEVMLYDEPTTGLDPIMTDVINELILQTRKTMPVTSIVVTHEMRTVNKVADRVIMLSPLSRLKPNEPQVIFDGTTDQLFKTADQRVQQFIHGEAKERTQDSDHNAHRDEAS
ncbi:MAG: ATP-binding cassette domain-containing protein [Planctomycetota bacterium]|nr:ATP-binding cassette domain-containing protein [Planctomycetota bacterium]